MFILSDISLGRFALRRRYLAACATGALLITGFDVSPAHAQQTQAGTRADLPPVVVQSDGSLRRAPAAESRRSTATRRSARVTR